MVAWFVLQEWHTQAQLPVLGAATWKCHRVTAASSWWPEQTAHCTPLNKRNVFYYHKANHLGFCPTLSSTGIIPSWWQGERGDTKFLSRDSSLMIKSRSYWNLHQHISTGTWKIIYSESLFPLSGLGDYVTEAAALCLESESQNVQWQH